jgi:hypothetical protein
LCLVGNRFEPDQQCEDERDGGRWKVSIEAKARLCAIAGGEATLWVRSGHGGANLRIPPDSVDRLKGH